MYVVQFRFSVDFQVVYITTSKLMNRRFLKFCGINIDEHHHFLKVLKYINKKMDLIFNYMQAILPNTIIFVLLSNLCNSSKSRQNVKSLLDQQFNILCKT